MLLNYSVYNMHTIYGMLFSVVKICTCDKTYDIYYILFAIFNIIIDLTR